MQELGVFLEQEDDDSGFLGVTLERERNIGFIEMKQTGLIQRIIEAVGLENGMVKVKFIPSEHMPLVKDFDVKPPSRVLGILIYLSGHNRPDLVFLSISVRETCFVPRDIMIWH